MPAYAAQVLDHLLVRACDRWGKDRLLRHIEESMQDFNVSSSNMYPVRTEYRAANVVPTDKAVKVKPPACAGDGMCPMSVLKGNSGRRSLLPLAVVW